jgi:hypothetical protein
MSWLHTVRYVFLVLLLAFALCGAWLAGRQS